MININDSIKYIHPTLEFWKDYIVQDDWQWPYIKWYNKTIPQPTQAELEIAWVSVQALQQADKDKAQKRADILKIASLEEQINMLAREVYNLTKNSNDPETVKSKQKYEAIKLIRDR